MKKNLLIGGSSLFAVSIALLGGWLMRGCSERKADERDRVAFEQALGVHQEEKRQRIKDTMQRNFAMTTLQIEGLHFPADDDALGEFFSRLQLVNEGKSDPTIERMLKLIVDCGNDQSKPAKERIENQEKLARHLIQDFLSNRR